MTDAERAMYKAQLAAQGVTLILDVTPEEQNWLHEAPLPPELLGELPDEEEDA